MSWWEAIVLGLVQGFTEFLPISSDGHLALFESLFRIQDLPLTFDIMVHGGTLVTMLIFFRRQLIALRTMDWLILGFANIPVIILGILLRPHLNVLSTNNLVVAGCFLFTALSVWIADMIWFAPGKFGAVSKINTAFEKVEELSQRWLQRGNVRITVTQAMIVGLFQSLAVLPGLSRSGSCLLGGSVAGLKRDQAFTFAFVLGTPAIFGAVVYDLLSVAQAGEWSNQPWDTYLLGAVSAAIFGWIALQFLSYIMNKSRLRLFAAYCVFVSIVSFFVV